VLRGSPSLFQNRILTRGAAFPSFPFLARQSELTSRPPFLTLVAITASWRLFFRRQAGAGAGTAKSLTLFPSVPEGVNRFNFPLSPANREEISFLPRRHTWSRRFCRDLPNPPSSTQAEDRPPFPLVVQATKGSELLSTSPPGRASTPR